VGEERGFTTKIARVGKIEAWRCLLVSGFAREIEGKGMEGKFSGMRAQTRLQDTVLLIGLSLMALIWLVPFFTVLLTSLRTQGDLISNGVFAWPEQFAWANFERAWTTGRFSTYFRNSALLILTKVPLGILVASLAAYPLAKMRFALNMPIFIFFLLGLSIPIHVTLTPLLVMMKQLGIAGNLAALIPPYVVFGLPFQIFVMRGFFRTVPGVNCWRRRGWMVRRN
jgi:raffinose/stachyose/melibiose transport system permease protein